MVGNVQKKVTKDEACVKISSLIQTVANGAGAVAITDHGKVITVLVSKQEYEWLHACAKQGAPSERRPRGAIILDDNDALDQARIRVREDFENALSKTASEL